MAKNKGTQKKEVEKALTFKLTEKDKANYAEQMAATDAAIAKLETEMKAAQTSLKDKIAGLEDDRREVSAKVRAGEEERTVKCDMVLDFNEGIVKYVFKGQEMERRPMENHERQMEILNPPKKTKAKKDEAKAPEQKATSEGENIAKAIAEETNKKTKRSAVDGPVAH